MKLLEMRKKQKELDMKISERMGFDLNDENIIENLIVALSVECAEMANEIRSFKHWSIKSMNMRNAVEEMSDCLHFALSILNCVDSNLSEVTLNSNSVKFLDGVIDNEESGEVKKFFNNAYMSLQSLCNDMKEAKWELDDYEYYGELKNDCESIIYTLLSILYVMGLRENALTDAYFKKNKTNFERQENNY